MKLLKYWLPPILWGLIIFSFSSLQVGSSNEIYWKDFVIKKTAHIVEYSILAVLLYRAMIGSDVEKKKAQFLYRDNDSPAGEFNFMDPQSFEQFSPQFWEG